MATEARNALSVSRWREYERIYDFMGNDILRPLNQTGKLSGILPVLWDKAPVPDSESGKDGLVRLQLYARAAQSVEDVDPNRDDIAGVVNVASEYEYLFVDVPHKITASFTPREGVPTLRELYQRDGLEMKGESRAHERYLDIQLIYLAHLCGRAADDMLVASDEARDIVAATLPTAQRVADFIEDFPLSWIGALREQVDAVRPAGYFSALFAYLEGLLEHQLAELEMPPARGRGM